MRIWAVFARFRAADHRAQRVSGLGGLCRCHPRQGADLDRLRYTIAIRLEVDEAVWTIGEIETGGPLASVSGFLTAGEVLGYDPQMHTIGGVVSWSQAVAKVQASLRPVSKTRSTRSGAISLRRPPVVPHGLDYSGLASVDKRRTLAADLLREGLSAQVINQSDRPRGCSTRAPTISPVCRSPARSRPARRRLGRLVYPAGTDHRRHASGAGQSRGDFPA